ncbi:RAMP superfamily CRISPR-associated protein [Methanocella conradii]|uniref:RAMP superfamily CRISPR-associated protein n=1 Tax=Methanocella conradii TaxID=1175444 RepID=UPI0024B37DD5|nr:RAMP superfamily CRISPR-associated protein [Methanocella conradii]MDI6895773.1 hypothetical protein [Methanocella conradii]
MTWYLYSWTFQLKSPLHIGFHKVMHLSMTRPYIPAKLIWAALTAKLTPLFRINDYQAIGNLLKNSMRFGYLYPYVKNQLYLPKYTENGLAFGDLPKNEFEKNFISSTMSNAIESDSLSSEEGMLHEIEFINPYKIDNKEKVFMKGLVWIKEFPENEINNVKMENNKLFVKYDGTRIDFGSSILSTIQVGGERKYGFGLLELKIIDKHRSLDIFPGEWFEKEDEVYLNLKKDMQIWSHALHTNNIDIKGNIEPIVGRDWSNKGPGRKLSAQNGLYWSPGSILNEDKTFKINEFGLWTPQ